MSGIKHYGDEWAAANHREMLARRFHIVTTYSGTVIASAHVETHAIDIRDEHYNQCIVVDTKPDSLAKVTSQAIRAR